MKSAELNYSMCQKPYNRVWTIDSSEQIRELRPQIYTTKREVDGLSGELLSAKDERKSE